MARDENSPGVDKEVVVEGGDEDVENGEEPKVRKYRAVLCMGMRRDFLYEGGVADRNQGLLGVGWSREDGWRMVMACLECEKG